MKQYPDQIDGLQRYAELWEARGDKHKAAEYYTERPQPLLNKQEALRRRP